MNRWTVGQGIDRIDARLKVTGKADYAAEAQVPGLVHAVIVTSTVARGRIASLDTKNAERAPGVLAVLSHLRAPKLPGIRAKTTPQDRYLQLFQDDRIVYNDQPIALVVADTLEHAQYGASRVVAGYETEPFSIDMNAEAPHAYAPENAGPHGTTDSRRGDVNAALGAAKVSVRQTYSTPVEHHNPMEPHAAVAVWQGEDRVTIYDTTQGIFSVRNKVATLFGIPKENVRIVSHYVGGGFGCKGSPWSYVALAAMGAKVTGRPVKLVVTRPQMFSLVGHRPHTVQAVALGADGDGKLTAISHDVRSPTSRFDEFVEPSALQTRMLYACANVSTSHRLVRLDIPTPTFTRAPGIATGTFALESAMDELAYALKMDPIALRLKNYAERDPDTGKPWSSKSLRECYRRGAEKFGWSRRTPDPRSMRDGRWLVGWGMASATYPATQRPASAVARIRADGSALVQAGSQDIGTGTYTIMTQIAADTLALPLARVRFELGDTLFPETPVSGGSQTAASVGSAVKMAGLEVRKKLIELAVTDPKSPLYGRPVAAIDAEEGTLFVKGNRARNDGFGDIVKRSGKAEIEARVDSPEKEDRKRYATHSFGAQFAEVKVDEDLGLVRLSRFVGAFAAGKILNAKTAESQLQGGIVWGIGLALHERTWRDDRSGRVMTRDLADYHVPVNADVPHIDVITVDEIDPHVNEIGAKGIGEIGITGTGAAIANAVFHATGRRIRDLPIMLDALL
ncbi:xanthine dehydrogenase family protein molybdopterin-binding subunit [Pendulispora rubella]|uniref:Xanthine dehydrogenase family protein molybdopterin-binding subunit n=1 Tax=Pendulispora rubella TaxID=2741070 RepID=A0ABZ2L0S4_9BACT